MHLLKKDLEHFYALADESYTLLAQQQGVHTILHYTGDLVEAYANALTSRLERLLDEQDISKPSKKRFLSVFVEAVQNIRIHGCSDDAKRIHADIVVFHTVQTVQAKFRNIVTQKQGLLLQKRYHEINSLDRETLKARYMDVMVKGEMSAKGGAGLGILTIVLRSQHKSEFKLWPLNSNYAIFEHMIQVGRNA